jgi:hypothetical protein
MAEDHPNRRSPLQLAEELIDKFSLKDPLDFFSPSTAFLRATARIRSMKPF